MFEKHYLFQNPNNNEHFIITALRPRAAAKTAERYCKDVLSLGKISKTLALLSCYIVLPCCRK